MSSTAPYTKWLNRKRNMEVANSSYRSNKNMIKGSLTVRNLGSWGKYKIYFVATGSILLSLVGLWGFWRRLVHLLKLIYLNALVLKSSQNHLNFKYILKNKNYSSIGRALTPWSSQNGRICCSAVSFCTWIQVFEVISPYKLTQSLVCSF